MWFILALLSAAFAALTSILAKIGIEGVSSTLATAIRTVVVVIMAWSMVFLTNTQKGIMEISTKSWVFLVLSGLATGASWLCYYKALQIGEASKVVPIDKLSVVITLILAFVFLHEQFTMKSLIGCILIGIGTLVMVVWCVKACFVFANVVNKTYTYALWKHLPFEVHVAFFDLFVLSLICIFLLLFFDFCVIMNLIAKQLNSLI